MPSIVEEGAIEVGDDLRRVEVARRLETAGRIGRMGADQEPVCVIPLGLVEGQELLLLVDTLLERVLSKGSDPSCL